MKAYIFFRFCILSYSFVVETRLTVTSSLMKIIKFNSLNRIPPTQILISECQILNALPYDDSSSVLISELLDLAAGKKTKDLAKLFFLPLVLHNYNLVFIDSSVCLLGLVPRCFIMSLARFCTLRGFRNF